MFSLVTKQARCNLSTRECIVKLFADSRIFSVSVSSLSLTLGKEKEIQRVVGKRKQWASLESLYSETANACSRELFAKNIRKQKRMMEAPEYVDEHREVGIQFRVQKNMYKEMEGFC